jgi:hypothetical protein
MGSLKMDDLDQIIGRREARRQPFKVSATLLTASRLQRVVIQDISSRGAKIWLGKPVANVQALLSWEDTKVWGEIMWCDGIFAGIRFYQEIESREDP